MLSKLVEWQTKLATKFKQNEPRGIISMDARIMKNELESFLKDSHKALREHASKLGKEIALNMEKNYNEIKNMLTATYVDLAGYVKYTSDLQYAKEMEL